MTDFKSWSLTKLKQAAAGTSPSIVETSSNYFQIGAETMMSSQDDFMSTVRSLQSAWQGQAAQAAMSSAQQSYAQMQLTHDSANTSQTRSSDYATSVDKNRQQAAAIDDVDTSFTGAVKKGWMGGALGVGAAAYMQQQKYNAHRDQAAEVVATMDSDGSNQATDVRSATWPTSTGFSAPLGTLPPPPAHTAGGDNQDNYSRYLPKGGGSTGGYTTAGIGPSTSTFTGVSPGTGKKKKKGTDSLGTGGKNPSGGSGVGPTGGGTTSPSGGSTVGSATDPAGNLGGVGGSGAGAGSGSGAGSGLPGAGASAGGGGGNGALGGAAAAGGLLGGAGVLGGLAGRGGLGAGGGLRGGGLRGGLGEGEGGTRGGVRGGAGAGEGEGGTRGGLRGGAGAGEGEGGLRGSGGAGRGGSGLGEEGRVGGSRGAAGLGDEAGVRGGARGMAPEENLARGMRPGGFAGEPVAEAGRGGYPLSPGGGRRNGSDDEEAPVPDYLVETDDIWGDGSSAAPAVIGE